MDNPLEELKNNPKKIKELIQNPEKLKELIKELPEENRELIKKLLQEPEKLKELIMELPTEEKVLVGDIINSTQELIKKEVDRDIKYNKQNKQTVSMGELFEFAQEHKDDSLYEFYSFIKRERVKNDEGINPDKVLRAIWIFNDCIKKGRVKPDDLK